MTTNLQQKVIHALNNPTRLTILERLSQGEATVNTLTAQIGTTSQSNISQQLACLRDCGLIKQRRSGKYCFYRLSSPEITVLLQEIDRVSAALNWTATTPLACSSQQK
ncbi:ArsR/SmtB family transcription factor [Lapidilactobacillus salsurivasis]